MQEGWHKLPVNGPCFFLWTLGVVCMGVLLPNWLCCSAHAKEAEHRSTLKLNCESPSRQILDAGRFPLELAKNPNYPKVWLNKGSYFFQNPFFWILTKPSASCRYQELSEVNNDSVGVCLEGLFWQVIFH